MAAVYANALVDLAQSKNALDTVHADVDSLQVGLLKWLISRVASITLAAYM